MSDGAGLPTQGLGSRVHTFAIGRQGQRSFIAPFFIVFYWFCYNVQCAIIEKSRVGWFFVLIAGSKLSNIQVPLMPGLGNLTAAAYFLEMADPTLRGDRSHRDQAQQVWRGQTRASRRAWNALQMIVSGPGNRPPVSHLEGGPSLINSLPTAYSKRGHLPLLCLHASRSSHLCTLPCRF